MGYLDVSKEARLLLWKVLQEIVHMPQNRGEVITMMSKEDFNLMLELKKAKKLDFVLQDIALSSPLPKDEPFITKEQKLYMIMISFRKKDNIVMIETHNNKFITYTVSKIDETVSEHKWRLKMEIEELLNELPEKIEVKGKRVKGDVCNLTIEKIAGGWTVYYGSRLYAYAFTHKESLKEALEVVKNILIKEGHMEVQND